MLERTSGDVHEQEETHPARLPAKEMQDFLKREKQERGKSILVP